MKEQLEQQNIESTKGGAEKPIINSLLWTDLYKITMGQAAFHQYKEVGAHYEFINRGKTLFPQNFAQKLREQVNLMSQISLQKDEREFLEEKCPFLDKDYLDWFQSYRFNPDEVKITENEKGELKIDIEGPWHRTIYWEVPLMALICELYYQESNQKPDKNYLQKARAKAKALEEAGAKFLDFGTRRAFSNRVHRKVLETLKKYAKPIDEGGVLLGSSNVKLAQIFNLNPSGTYAHEWVMAHAAIYGVKNANKKAMEAWADEYLGRAGKKGYPKLGTALMDTYTTEVFLRDLDTEILQYYPNLRQDSGDPVEQANKTINRLEELGVDPKSKGIVFSDSLSTKKATFLQKMFEGVTNPIFGIGTHFTNDVGAEALNIVIKAFAFTLENGERKNVIKLSDDLGKVSGDAEAVKGTKEALGIAA